jgi:hypothetical protein
MTTRIAPLLLIGTLLLGGCASIGPGSVNRDRHDYSTALSESWKRQILLNLVKLRYVEPLCFMDVGQIVAAYTLQTGVDLAGQRTSYDYAGPTDNSMVRLGVTGSYTDRPTITYTPLTGKAFMSGVMLPIPAQNLLVYIQSGASADILLKLCVASINGLRNEGATTAGYRPPDPGFVRAVELIRTLQLSGSLRVKVGRGGKDHDGSASLTLPAQGLPPESAAQAAELRTLLGLDPGAETYHLASGPGSGDPKVISLQCLSLMQIMASLAGRVEVPEADVAAGRAIPGLPARQPAGVEPRIKTAATEPSDVFSSVRFHNHWFYVDDRDLATKRVFSFILLAFTLLDDTKHDSPIQLTVPTQ